VPLFLIFLYAFTTEEKSFQWPPPGLTLKWFPVAAARPDIWAALTLSQRRDVTAGPAPAGPTSAPAAVPPHDATAAAAATSVATASPAPAAAPAKAISVALETIRPVWMRITLDGVRGFEGELPAGEKLAVEGDQTVVVRAGDAGGVRATVNGVDRGPLGRDGWPLTVSITPQRIEPLTPTRPEP